MRRPISRPLHGLLGDYPFIALVSAAPQLLGFADEAPAANLCRALSGGTLLSSLLTRAEWGVFRVMPYNAHLLADAAIGLFSLGAPWLFGFDQNGRARNTFLAMGVISLVVSSLSQPDGAELPSEVSQLT
jgi:hypothetical protein